MTPDKREIKPPKTEIDVPPQKTLYDKDDISNLTPEATCDWRKWLKNLDFVKYVVSVMLFLFIVDIFISIFAPTANLALREPFFEALKTLLFTAAGYVFAKSSD